MAGLVSEDTAKIPPGRNVDIAVFLRLMIVAWQRGAPLETRWIGRKDNAFNYTAHLGGLRRRYKHRIPHILLISSIGGLAALAQSVADVGNVPTKPVLWYANKNASNTSHWINVVRARHVRYH